MMMVYGHFLDGVGVVYKKLSFSQSIYYLMVHTRYLSLILHIQGLQHLRHLLIQVVSSWYVT